MKPWKKLAVVLVTATGATLVAGVGWFLWLLASSPSEPDGFGQDHQEQWAVTSCWRSIRDGQISGTDQCSDYAQAHLEFFSEHLAADAATTTCNLSRAHLLYAQRHNPQARRLLQQLNEEVDADCRFGSSRKTIDAADTVA